LRTIIKMSNRLTKRFGAVSVLGTATLGDVSIAKSTVTQTTSITSGVTLNSPAGVIDTVSSTLATNGSTSFTVTNSFVDANSVVLSNIVNYSGNAGAPFSRVQGVTSGSFSISIRNVHAEQALNGVIKLAFTTL
jgi:hypothetical protein